MADGFGAQPSAAGNVEFGNLWFVVRRHLWSVIALVVLAVGGTYAYLSNVEPVYKAQATMVLTPSDTRVSQTNSQLETFELSRSFVETELDVIRSRDFASALADHLGLFSDPDFLQEETTPSDQPISSEERRDAVIEKTRNSYSVFRQGESLALDVVGSSNRPELAADLANGVVEVYIKQSQDEQREAIQSSIGALERNIVRQGEILSAKEIELTNLIRGDNLDDPEISERLRSEIERLKALISVSERQGVNNERLAQQVETLAQAEDELEKRTRQELVLKRTEREIDLQRLRYESMIGRLNELQVQADTVGNQTRHVTVARSPDEPAWPNLRFALVAAGLAALTVGFLLAVIREGLDRRIHSEMQVFQSSGLQSLGYIPRISHRLFQRRVDPVSSLLDRPHSAFSEAIRGVLTLWSIKRGKRVLMIASGLPGEGKTCLAVAMATSSSLDGARTLLVDLDIHRHGASQLLGCEPVDMSLFQMIDERTPPQTAKHGDKPLENLEILTFKRRSKASQEAFSKKLKEFLFTLSEKYDLVVVDTPPTLLTNDACQHAEMVEEAILVARWGHTKVATLADTQNRLNRAGIDVFAAVLNDVDLERHRRYGYGGYIGAYSQGYAYAEHS